MLGTSKLQIANCKLQNEKWGVRPGRQFAICNLRSRRAITLTEVLISMGILTLGLLGVAALFPVGGYYMQQAEISDRGSAIAQYVMSDIVARGMLNPAAWYVIIPPAGGTQGTSFPSDGKYAPSVKKATYSRPFAHTLLEALSQPAASTDPTLIGKQFGSAFVIDPMGTAAMAFPGASVSLPSRHGPVSTFPATGYRAFGYYNPATTMWQPWAKTPGASVDPWPIRRVTFRQSSSGWQMDATMAEHFFRASDDLSTDLPQRDDRPARQNWDTTTIGSTQTPLARQWAGDYSWIVTVVPTTNAARDGMARNPEGHAYDVSVVVFHKRALPEGAQAVLAKSGSSLPDYLNAMGENERMVKATIVSTGLNGGELLLTDWEENPGKSPFDGLKTGQWIMLCGPHPNSSTSNPRFALNWYQVLSIDSEGTGIIGFDRAKHRVVALRGPQWPWVPGGPTYDNLCVAICRGAVAVHTKTLRLENPQSSPVTFGEGGSFTTTPPKFGLY